MVSDVNLHPYIAALNALAPKGRLVIIGKGGGGGEGRAVSCCVVLCRVVSCCVVYQRTTRLYAVMNDVCVCVCVWM